MRDILNIDWEKELQLFENGVTSQWDFYKKKQEETEDECIPKNTIYCDGNKKSKKYDTPLDIKSLAKLKKKDKVRSITRKVKKQFERKIAEQA